MLHFVVASLLGLGVTIVTALAVYFGWLRPMWIEVAKRREDVEAAERRAQNETENRRESILLQAKEEALRFRERAEEEAREKTVALGRTEDRLCQKEETLEERRRQLEDRDSGLLRETRALADKEDSIDRRIRSIDEEFQRVSNLTKTQARDTYLKRIETEFKEIGQRRAREIEATVLAEADRRAKKVILDVDKRLKNLFARSFPEAKVYGTRAASSDGYGAC